MKKRGKTIYILFLIGIIAILTIPLASAGLWNDFWNKITGKAIISQQDPIAYYPFEGNANDVSGNGNNGVVNGATLTIGKTGQAYSFDGNDYINLKTRNLMNNKFTISAWVKSPIGGINNILTQGLNIFSIESGKLKFQRQSSLWETISSINSINDNNWHYVAIIHSGIKAGETKLYIDGVRDDNRKAIPNVEYLYINKIGVDSAKRFFKGYIDEVKVWNRALTDIEITQDYQNNNLCIPKCDGKQCGDDECGGSCGDCTNRQICNSNGQCQNPETQKISYQPEINLNNPNFLVSVKSFGAVGDGVTDDSSAIQNAVNYAQKRGKIVFIPAGRYIINSRIEITNHVIIQGEGYERYMHKKGTFIITGTNNQDAFFINTMDSVVIRDLGIIANSLIPNTGGAGIRVGGKDFSNVGSRFENLYIDKQNYGIIFQAMMHGSLRNSYITDFGNVGVEIMNLHYCDEGSNTITGVMFFPYANRDNPPIADIRYRSGGDWEISNNKLIGGINGIHLLLTNKNCPTGTLIISSNSIEEQKNWAINLEQDPEYIPSTFANIIIKGNQFQRSDPVVSIDQQWGVLNIESGYNLNWLESVIFSDNVISYGIVYPENNLNKNGIINIKGGNGITIANNIINTNFGNPIPFKVFDTNEGGKASNVLILDNQIINFPKKSTKYSVPASKGKVRETVIK